MPNGAIGVKHRGGADEAAPVGVVIAGVEVVHPAFDIVVITTITEGIVMTEGGCQGSRNAQIAAPGIVGIADDQRARGIENTEDITKNVLVIVIILPVPVQPDGRTVLVVVIIELMGYGAVFVLAGFCDDGAAVQHVVNGFGNLSVFFPNLIRADAVGVVGIVVENVAAEVRSLPAVAKLGF